MAATAAQIAEVRRMCALDVDDATYLDSVLTSYIEETPLLDERGEEPYTWDGSTEPPTEEANDSWIATYDLHAAAAKVWGEKAGAVAMKFDATADGASLMRSQIYKHYMDRVFYHSSCRSATTMTFHKWPKEITGTNFPWIGNLAEPD